MENIVFRYIKFISIGTIIFSFLTVSPVVGDELDDVDAEFQNLPTGNQNSKFTLCLDSRNYDECSRMSRHEGDLYKQALDDNMNGNPITDPSTIGIINRVRTCQMQIEASCRSDVRETAEIPLSISSGKQASGDGVDNEDSPAPAGSGSVASLPGDAEIAQGIQACEQSKTGAYTCCQDPVKCVNEDSEFSLGNMQMITALAQAGSALSGGGLEEQCKRAQSLNNFGAIANSAMAVTCQTQKGKCEDVCGELGATYETHYQQCLAAQKADAAISCTKYQTAASTLKRRASSCQALAGQVQDMGLAAVSQVQAAKMAQLCAEQAGASQTAFNTDGVSTDCTDPANASNPFCKNCADPAMANDPVCQQINATGGNTYQSGDTYNAGGGASQYAGQDGVDTGDNSLLVDQGINFGENQAVAAKSTGVRPGGGGMPGGGGGGGSPFAGQGGPRGPGKSAFKTDTLHGVSGGGGYSVSGMGFQNPGGGGSSYKGYGSRDFEANKRMKKFNLKDFIPKVHKPLLDRTPAGQIAKDIGSSNSKNVFQKVHDLFVRHCKSGDFYDCQNIKQQQIILMPAANASSDIPSPGKGRFPASVAMQESKNSCVTDYRKKYCVKQYANQSCYNKAVAYCK